MGDKQGEVPEIVPSNQESVQLLWWSVTPRTVKIVKVLTTIPGVVLAGWLFQNFLTLRGVVDLVASRIDLAFLAVCLFAIGYAFTINTTYKAISRTVIGVVVLLVSLGLDRWAPKPTAPAKNGTLPVIYLGCESIGLPISVGARERAYIFDPIVAAGGLALLTFAPNPSGLWPDLKFGWMYRCDVINYSNEVVFHLGMVFNCTIREVISTDNGKRKRWTSGKIVASHGHPIETPRLDASGGKFSFYVWNGSQQVAEVLSPEQATLELPNNQARISVRMKLSSAIGPIKMTLGPREFPK